MMYSSPSLFPQVGQNFLDKAMYVTGTTFPISFEYLYDNTWGVITGATYRGEGYGAGVFEEVSIGSKIPGLFDFIAFERFLIPASKRDKLPGILFKTASSILGAFSEFDERCVLRLMATFVSEPTSKGEVTLDWLGNVQIRGGYLSSQKDLATFGANVRAQYDLMTDAVTGPLAPQTPCEDENDQACREENPCPYVLKSIQDVSAAMSFTPSSPVSI